MIPAGDTVFIGYGPPGGMSTTLIDMWQGRAGSFDPLARSGSISFEEMQTTGIVTPMPGGEGYYYAEPGPPSACTAEAVERDPECGTATIRRYGAVLERDGTLIHIQAAPKLDGGRDTNPFSSAEAVRELVEMLQPIP